jgi:hypothetical protein
MASTIYSPLEERQEDRRELWHIPRVCTMLQHPSMDAQKRVPQDFTQKLAEQYGIPEFSIEFAGLDTHTAPLLRLLVLEPGSGDEIIQCMLEQHDLRRKPHFEALSYCWGDTANLETIICRGEAMVVGMTIPVGRNLEAALKRLRYPEQKRVLWIDALCINQADPLEKNSQVKMMDYIYSCADRVLVWLGEEQAQDSSAIEAIDKTNAYIDSLWHDGSIADTVSKIINNPDLPPNAWQHVSALFRRPYFQRLWVIQEVVKSRSAQVLCGDKTILWESMCTVAGLLAPGLLSACPPDVRRATHLPNPDESNIRLIQSLVETKSGPHPGRPFFDIVLQAQTFKSTMPRDKLFALLNLAWVEDKWLPCPNYQCSDLEVFRNFVLIDVVENKSIKALSWVNTAGVDRNSGWPFWVPTIADFEGPKPSFFVERGRPQGHIQRLPEAVASSNESKTALTVRGRLLCSPVAVIATSRSALYEKAGLALPLQSADFTKATIEVERNWLRSCYQAFLVSKWKVVREDWNNKVGKDEFMNLNLDDTLFQSSNDALINSVYFITFILVLTCNWNSYGRAPIIPWIPPWTETGPNANPDAKSELVKTVGFYKIPESIANVTLNAKMGPSRHTNSILDGKAESDEMSELPDGPGLLEYIQDIIKRLIRGHTISSANWEDYLNTVTHEYTKWKTFCGLEDGRIGWVPNNVRSKDRVCVFKGGRESFLLRAARGEKGNKSLNWELHGECYFEGLKLGVEYLLEKDRFEDLALGLI